jgi:hypothetical protein
MTSTPTVQKGKNMKLKIALLSVAMSSAYIFPVQYSQQRNMKLPWLQKSMVSHGLTGWGLA